MEREKLYGANNDTLIVALNLKTGKYEVVDEYCDVMDTFDDLDAAYAHFTELLDDEL